jgi:AcrR family transcriptional regulator
MSTTGGAVNQDRGRTTYRHGDLRPSLLRAGYELAQAGGPAAVTLRESTRRAGVTPNAAYRHFADRQALLASVCDAAQAALANTIEDEQAALEPSRDRRADAVALFRAVGTGYVRFARQEPGLFRTAFSVPDNLGGRGDPVRVGRNGKTPFQLLTGALDQLVEVGLISPADRPGAEFLAWSAVHGLSTLAIDGPLRQLDDEHVRAISTRLVEMVELGLSRSDASLQPGTAATPEHEV